MVMKKWSNDKDVLLLLAIMDSMRIKIPEARWDEISKNFDGTLTGGACRRRYQEIRSSSGLTKSRQRTKANMSSSNLATNGLRSNSATQSAMYRNNEDDEEEEEDKRIPLEGRSNTLFNDQEPKSRSMEFKNTFNKFVVSGVKIENGQNDEQLKRSFKLERVDMDGAIVLNDD